MIHKQVNQYLEPEEECTDRRVRVSASQAEDLLAELLKWHKCAKRHHSQVADIRAYVTCRELQSAIHHMSQGSLHETEKFCTSDIVRAFLSSKEMTAVYARYPFEKWLKDQYYHYGDPKKEYSRDSFNSWLTGLYPEQDGMICTPFYQSGEGFRVEYDQYQRLNQKGLAVFAWPKPENLQ